MTPPPDAVTMVVDRLEGRQVVLVADDGGTHTVPRRWLPAAIGEGTVLRVPHDARGGPAWAAAVVDAAEETRRRADLAARLRRLRAADDGGDITL